MSHTAEMVKLDPETFLPIEGNGDCDIAVKTKIVTKIKPKLNVPLPSLFDVIYVNDDKTSFEFVIASLIQFFGYTDEVAADLAHTVHTHGQSVVATLSYEMAQQKAAEVIASARSFKFPLAVKVVESKK